MEIPGIKLFISVILYLRQIPWQNHIAQKSITEQTIIPKLKRAEIIIKKCQQTNQVLLGRMHWPHFDVILSCVLLLQAQVLRLMFFPSLFQSCWNKYFVFSFIFLINQFSFGFNFLLPFFFKKQQDCKHYLIKQGFPPPKNILLDHIDCAKLVVNTAKISTIIAEGYSG